MNDIKEPKPEKTADECGHVDIIIIPTDNPIDWIPYKNRWGHWVWRRKDIPEDKNWPGIKPPNNNVVPKVIANKWCWV